MAEYTKIDIDVCENGFVVTADGKSRIFSSVKKLKDWLRENIAPTGELKEFCDNLGSDSTNKKEKSHEPNYWKYIPSINELDKKQSELPYLYKQKIQQAYNV